MMLLTLEFEAKNPGTLFVALSRANQQVEEVQILILHFMRIFCYTMTD